MVRQVDTQLVEAQFGVVTRAQLLAFGVSASAIDARVHRGALRRLHRGVYAVAHTALRDEGRWLAAVLACGDGAVLSHTSAAALWSFSSVPADPAVHVTVPAAHRRRHGIVVHRATLTRADVTVHRGVPVTTKARTVVDIAAIVPYASLRRMTDRGVRLDEQALRSAAARSRSRRGTKALQRLLGDDVRTRSDLERRLRRLALGAGLEPPRTNVRILGRERDFAWAEHRLVVEVDGHAFHAPRGAREVDHERDAELQLAGWRALRFTGDQLEHEPEAVTARLRRAAGP